MKNVSIILILSLLISCNNDKEFFSKEIVKEYSKGDFNTPSVYGHLMMFVKVDVNKIALTNIGQLHSMYLMDYSKYYNTFESYLFEVLNQNINFQKDYISKRNGLVFNFNSGVKKNYESLSLVDFVHYYSENDGKSCVIKSKYAKPETLFTILYFLFINHYEIIHDDYVGKYYIEKR